MNASNRILLVALFAVLATMVMVVGGYILLRTPNTATELLGVADLELPEVQLPRRASNTKPVSAHALSRAQEQLRHLQQTLRDTQVLLERRTESLRAKDAECATLQQELDESIAFYFSTLAGANQDQSPVATDLAAQIKALQAEFQRRSRGWGEQRQQLDELQATILEMETQMEVIQLAAADEISMLLTDRTAMAEALQDVVELLDEDAVQALTDLLVEPRPAVRVWAAQALGQLGRESAAAIPALMALLDDEFEEVRTSAQQALTAIER